LKRRFDASQALKGRFLLVITFREREEVVYSREQKGVMLSAASHASVGTAALGLFSEPLGGSHET
jgi:hypothetical protein